MSQQERRLHYYYAGKSLSLKRKVHRVNFGLTRNMKYYGALTTRPPSEQKVVVFLAMKAIANAQDSQA